MLAPCSEGVRMIHGGSYGPSLLIQSACLPKCQQKGRNVERRQEHVELATSRTYFRTAKGAKIGPVMGPPSLRTFFKSSRKGSTTSATPCMAKSPWSRMVCVYKPFIEQACDKFTQTKLCTQLSAIRPACAHLAKAPVTAAPPAQHSA